TNRDYEEKFGFIYIVCATGKSAEEMLTIARERLANEREQELRIAADEQLKITKLRMMKLVG
ncbi:MAG TPA: 2-oxo-4-hydroxy-4-carboxy-5-ureidoimidazoline decarboxylase, partial [Thermoanaerobaculia bacterium]|nr:2-oxo-4-hydroxy-4-carboxy-5-ureidoimidazoline decarboxylase [Thermoanaerobaculia bacterium]